MKISRVFAWGMAAAMLGLSVPGRAAEEPTVESIVNRYLKEMGGKEAMEKVKSRVLKVKLESEQLGASDGEVFAKFPNKLLSRMELSGQGTIEEGFDGTVAWAKSPWEGLRVKSGDELAKAKRDAEFFRELTYKKFYPDLAFKGTAKVDEEEAFVLESKPTATSKEKFLYSRKTGLMLRQECEFQGPQGAVTVVTLPRSYKTFDGLKYPAEMKLKMSFADQSFDFTIKITEVKHNVEIEEAKFAKPGA